MQDEAELIATTQAMDIQADRFPIVTDTVIQEEEPVVPNIALQEVVPMDVAISTPRTLPQALALLPPLMRPTTSVQQIPEHVMDLQRPPTSPESLESIPNIVVVAPSREDDDKDVAGPALTVPSDDTSLSPHQGEKKSFRCPRCPDTAPQTFTRQFDLKRHIDHKHQEMTSKEKRALTCPCCYEVLSRKDAFRRHCSRVPASCLRNARLRNKSDPPPQPESLYKLCRAGKPPAPDRMPIPES